MSRKRSAIRGAAAVLIALTPLAATACTSQDTLRVCISLPYEPFQFKDAWQDNKIVGFDIDIMELVAKKLDVKPEFVDTDFKALDDGSALRDDKCEIVAAAMTITPTREKTMMFSDSYYESDQALAALPDSGMEGLKDMQGKSLGIQRDTTGAAYAEETQDHFEFRTKLYADLGTLREAVEYGEVDAALNDVPLWTSQVNGDPKELEILERFDTGEKYAYAVRHEDKELLGTVNEVLDDSKANGDFAAIYEKWIGEKYPPDSKD